MTGRVVCVDCAMTIFVIIFLIIRIEKARYLL